MTAGILPEKNQLVIEQGQKFAVVFTLYTDNPPTSELDLTGYTARMKVTKDNAYGDSQLDISTDDYITLGGAAGTITVSVPASVTSDISAFNKGYFQVNITPSSGDDDSVRVLQGPIVCRAENTGA